MNKLKQVGKVLQYDAGRRIAEVKLTAVLRTGDPILIKGDRTNFEQTVQFMFKVRKPVQEAKSGDIIWLGVIKRVYKDDKVFLDIARQQVPNGPSKPTKPPKRLISPVGPDRPTPPPKKPPQVPPRKPTPPPTEPSPVDPDEPPPSPPPKPQRRPRRDRRRSSVRSTRYRRYRVNHDKLDLPDLEHLIDYLKDKKKKDDRGGGTAG
jgi:outer membrane biosynthesis protein TonB